MNNAENSDVNKEKRIQEMLDREDIHNVVMRYCRACDRIDTELLKTVFHKDARLEYGAFNGSATEFVPWVILHIQNDFKHGYHAICNEYITVDGEQAYGEIYAMINDCVVDEKGQLAYSSKGGRYVDKYEKRKGEWRISYRTFILDWVEYKQINEKDDGVLNRGRRDGEDISYSILPEEPDRKLDW